MMTGLQLTNETGRKGVVGNLTEKKVKGARHESGRILLEATFRALRGKVSRLKVHRYTAYEKRTAEEDRPLGNRRWMLGGNGPRPYFFGRLRDSRRNTDLKLNSGSTDLSL